MKKILIRADGGKGIGMGHIMRTCVLAEVLRERYNTTYICSASPDFQSGVEYLKSKGFAVLLFENDSDLYEKIREHASWLLITDSYSAGTHYFDRTKELANKTMIFDDNNLLPFYNADIILNQNIGAQNYMYCCGDSTVQLLGANYIILREQFRNSAIREKDFSKVQNVLITMGGADPTNATEKILKFVKDRYRYCFHVVVGNAYLNKEKLKRLESENIKIYVNPDMFMLMQKCDIAISSCGSTIYELAALGIPTIGIVTAENQVNASKKMHQKGLVFLAGRDNCLKIEPFCELLNEFTSNKPLLDNLSKAAASVINRGGVNEIVNKINCLN